MLYITELLNQNNDITAVTLTASFSDFLLFVFYTFANYHLRCSFTDTTAQNELSLLKTNSLALCMPIL